MSQENHLTCCRNCLGNHFLRLDWVFFIKTAIFHFGYQGIETNINKKYWGTLRNSLQRRKAEQGGFVVKGKKLADTDNPNTPANGSAASELSLQRQVAWSWWIRVDCEGKARGLSLHLDFPARKPGCFLQAGGRAWDKIAESCRQAGNVVGRSASRSPKGTWQCGCTYWIPQPLWNMGLAEKIKRFRQGKQLVSSGLNNGERGPSSVTSQIVITTWWKWLFDSVKSLPTFPFKTSCHQYGWRLFLTNKCGRKRGKFIWSC